MHALEVAGEPEVEDDFPGEDVRLGGRHPEPMALAPQGLEALGHVRIDSVLEDADRFEALAVEMDRLRQHGLVLGLKKLREAVAQRRADAVQQGFQGRSGLAQAHQRVLDAAGDPGAGVRERAVEVEEDVHGSAGA